MKKTLYLSLLAVLAITSCKKQESPDAVAESDSNLHANTKGVMTLPGQGATESWLYPNSDGTFSSAYGGDVKFTGIVYATGNYYDGEPVVSVSPILGDGQDGTISITSNGPFFMKTSATFSAPPNFYSSLQNFYAAYGQFLSYAINPSTGQPIQPSLPWVGDFVSSNTLSGPAIVTGQIVRSHASPSTFSIVAMTFIPPVRPVE